jgi:hypothetical protein
VQRVDEQKVCFVDVCGQGGLNLELQIDSTRECVKQCPVIVLAVFDVVTNDPLRSGFDESVGRDTAPDPELGYMLTQSPRLA